MCDRRFLDQTTFGVYADDDCSDIHPDVIEAYGSSDRPEEDDSDAEDEDEEAIREAIEEDLRPSVNHTSVQFPDRRYPFSSPMSEQVFRESFARLVEENIVPDGLGVLEGEWDEDGYPEMEHIKFASIFSRHVPELWDPGAACSHIRSLLRWMAALQSPPSSQAHPTSFDKFLSVTPSQRETARHPVYYFEDGPIVFLVESTLFRLHPCLLRIRSPLFYLMLDPAAPDILGGNDEGKSDDTPIEIIQASARDFECVLRWMYTPESVGAPWCQDTLIAVLRFAKKYDFPDALAFAKSRLETVAFQPVPSLRLILARRHTIPDWVRPAIRDLIRFPVSAIPPAHIIDLGVHTLHTLALAKEAIARLRTSLTSHIPSVTHGIRCVDMKPCQRGLAFCWTQVNVLVHNTGVSLTASDVMAKLDEGAISGLELMNPDCLRATLNEIRPLFNQEEIVTMEWVEKLAQI
ncbi:hypothetical protein BOTBODRAFT_182206 [Botryobasidium botryosum FD-172 SS1]|uniref:BTB domain-containing protein n=1 Tax=Botryobasidium botryosum (strain FD-172 SS1) TaxID=930990 RepID=A0A067LS25_BOTB1|nr:hypothetical protein BOTBODRAFT_182206 [Botryobasidium botryosum FD-172 SS1]